MKSSSAWLYGTGDKEALATSQRGGGTESGLGAVRGKSHAAIAFYRVSQHGAPSFPKVAR